MAPQVGQEGCALQCEQAHGTVEANLAQVKRPWQAAALHRRLQHAKLQKRIQRGRAGRIIQQ